MRCLRWKIGNFCQRVGRAVRPVMRDVTGLPPPPRVYDRRYLLSLCTTALRPSPAVVERVHSLGLWTVCSLRRTRHCLHLRCYRGRRAGRRRRPSPTLLTVANGASVIVSNRHAVCSVPRAVVRRPRSLLHVHVDRHSTPTGRELVFGCLNIRSIANKLDDLLEVRRDFTIDVLFLVETWHDTESVSLRRLRADGFQVVDRSRPQGSISVLLQVISWYHCPEFLWSSSLLSEAYITTVTTIRLRYDDTMTHSTTTEVIEIMICVRFDCDMTTTQLRWKNDMFIFCSRRIALNVSRCVRYVVVGS